MINATGATTVVPVDPLALQNYLKNAGVTIDPTDLPKIQQVIESQLSDQASRLALIQAEALRAQLGLAGVAEQQVLLVSQPSLRLQLLQSS